MEPRTRALPSATLDRIHTATAQEAEDKKALRRAILAAVTFHAGLLAVTLPSFTTTLAASPEQPKVVVVETVVFKPPPPETQPVIPQARARVVPIPDPTPEGPELLRTVDPVEFEAALVDDLVLNVPLTAPDPPPTGPRFVTSEVVKPQKLSGPSPRYTEIARKARIQGLVIVQSTIDEQGNVVDVRLIQGLPMGLSEAAMDAVRQWKFKPATLQGKPIAVYFNLNVTFNLS